MIRRLFALLALAGLASAPMAGWATYYAQLNAKVSSSDTGKGTVYAAKENTDSAWESATDSAKDSTSTKNGDVLLWAKAVPSSDQYIFSGWSETDGGDVKWTDNPCQFTCTAAGDADKTKETTRFAIFAEKPSVVDLSEADFSLSPASYNFDGTTKSVTETVSYGGGDLERGKHYTITEDTLSGVGSPADDTTYTVTITAIEGNGYTGTKTATWAIEAPSGSFDANALSAGAGCTASGNAAGVSDSAALAYDSAKNAWIASMTIKWPHKMKTTTSFGVTWNSGVDYYMDAANARIVIDAETVIGSDTLNGGKSGTGWTLVGANDEEKYGATALSLNNTCTFFSTLTYTVELTPEKIEAAKSAGSLNFPIMVYGLAWSGMSTGLKATTYTLTVAIGDDFPLTLPESATCDLGAGTLAVCKILMNKGAKVTSTSELDKTRLAVADGITGYQVNASGAYDYTCEAIEYPITYTYTGNDGNEPTNPNAATYTVEDEITFEAASLEGYIFNGWTPASIAKGTTGEQIVEGSFSKTYARIGDKDYPSLAAALEDANAGDTITVAADLPEAETITVPVGVTLDLGSHGNAGSSYVLTGAELNNDAKVVSTVKMDLAKFSAKGDDVADDFFKVVETEDSGTYTYALALNHEHLWGDFKLEGNVLTAKCTNNLNTCTYGDGTVSITLNAEGKVWDGDDSAVTPTLSGEEAFEALLTDGEQHAVTVGEPTVDHPAYSKDKWLTGAYTAKCTVTIDGVDYELEKAFEITKPEGGYTSGFETQIDGYDVRFDTVGEAISFVSEGAVFKYCSGDWSRKDFTFSSDKNITINLNGKKLYYDVSKDVAADLPIYNNGKGTVTLMNGTIQQPKGQQKRQYSSQYDDLYYNITLSGKFAFGEDLTVLKQGGNSFTVTANDSLKVVAGQYQSAFAGATEISGGVFTVKPTLLAEGYVVRTIGGEYPYQVFEHDHEYVTDIIGENTISNYCKAGGCDDAIGQWATIAVTTPLTYTTKAFAGVQKTGDLAATLTYFDGEAQLEGKPTAAGDDYKVVMSYNGKSIEKPFVIEPATIDSVTFNPATPDFTGSPITTKMTVKAGSLTLGVNDYDITAGSLTETGSASATTNIEVTVVGKDNFQGTKTESWTIKKPGTGSAAFKTPTLGGDYGTLNGTTLTIDEKSANLEEMSAGSGVWTMSMTVGVPLTSSGYTYIFTPEELLFFTKEGSAPIAGTNATALAECGIEVAHNSNAISRGTYQSKYKAASFTWTETITVAEAVAAAQAGEDKIVRTIKAYAVSYNEKSGNYTLTNEGGLPETTYTMEIPLATLKLVDEYGNQRYPVLSYVAKIGNIEYTSVSNALEAAAEKNETVELTAADPVAGAYDLPVGVTLKLGGYGNATATYKLHAGSKLISATVIDEARLSADTGLGVKDAQPVEGGFLYETYVKHVHEWTFAADGNVLTATCANSTGDCYLKDEYDCELKITLKAAGGEWTGSAIGADVTDGFIVAGTPEVKDYSVGEITYSAYSRDGEWGDSTATEPVQVGKYKAQVAVTVEGAEGSPFTLVKEYEITKPASYPNGYELKETGGHYTSFDAAVADARDGDTVVWWEGDKDQKEFEFTSDKDIIIDFNGATLTYNKTHARADGFTIKNDGTGTVTLVNGTINQPKGEVQIVIWVDQAEPITLSGNAEKKGKIVIAADANGKGVNFVNQATGKDNSLVVTVTNLDLEIRAGEHLAVFKKGTNGNIVIRGGVFKTRTTSDFDSDVDPKGFVDAPGDRHVIKKEYISLKYVFTVIPHTHVFTGSAKDGVLTVKCTGENSSLCNYKNGATITLTAANATATGEAYAGAAVDNKFAENTELAERCPEAAALSVDDVVYYTKAAFEADPRDEALPGAPVECGEYVATLSFGEATASVAFTIWHAEHSYVFTADDDADTITAKCVAEGPCEEERMEYVATLTVEDRLVDGEPCEATKDVDEGFPAEVALEYWQDQTKLDAAPSEVGSYVAKMIATTNSAPAAAVEKAFEIRAGKMTVNGKGYDTVGEAFADLLKDKGWATFNDTGIVYDGMTFQKGATLTVADDNSWTITNDGGTSLIAEKIPGKMNLTVDGTFELSGDIFVAPAGEDDTVVTVTNFLLDASITVGKESEGATDAMAYFSFYTFTNEDQANYRIALTKNGVVRSAEQLTIADVFAEVEHYEVVEKSIEGGYEYTLVAMEFAVNYYDNDGTTVVHTDKATIENYRDVLHIWDGARDGLALVGYAKESGDPLEQTDAALYAYIAEEAANPGCDGEVKVFGTWEKSTITITIAKDTGIADVQTNGVSVLGDLELPAETTQVELTLVANLDELTVPVFKVITNDVTKVTQRVATYPVVAGLKYTFIAEEAAGDPQATDDDVKRALVDAIDPPIPGDENDEKLYYAAVAKVQAVTAGENPAVEPKTLAKWIDENGINSRDMAVSDYVAASAKLNISPLIDEETEVEIVEFAMAEGNAMTFEVEIDSWGVEVEAIKDMVEASSDLSDWAANRLEVDATFEPGGEDEAGKVTITPKGSPGKAFLKVVIPKDPE